MDDIKLNDEYWDCECEHFYIHHKTESFCSKCGCHESDMPDSRQDEIDSGMNFAPTSESPMED